MKRDGSRDFFDWCFYALMYLLLCVLLALLVWEIGKGTA